MILFAKGLAIEKPVHPVKQNTILQRRTSAMFDLSGLMFRD
jgi:hypothetical protein